MKAFLPPLRLAALIALTTAAIAALLTATLGSAAAASRIGPAHVAEYPLKIAFFHTAPNRPRASAPFVAGIGVINEETGEAVQSGSVSCRAKIGKRSIRVRAKEYANGLAACAWLIAPKTGGRRFYATIALTSDEGYAARRFTKLIMR